ncbi:MAG: FAD-binding protein, partial [Coriobacteriales bacterium]|nr:FAD-binding protein [Coriobacteriales bacterium]
MAALGATAVGCSPTTSPTTAGTEGSGTANAASTVPEDSVWQIEKLGEPTETVTAQVCIVGGGGTGLAAGIRAREFGLDALVLERFGKTGGSFIGTEGLFAVGSHWQKAVGADFTAGEAIASCMEFHHWVPNYALYRAFFNKSAQTVDWLEGIGVEFDHVQSLGDSYVCWHVYKGSEHPGVEFMESMLKAANEAQLRIETDIAGKELVLDSTGAVEGVLALRSDGTVVKVE